VTSQVKVHETSISIGQIALTELDAGADIQLRVRLSCSDFCDLRGKIVNIIAPDASVKELLLTGFNGAENVVDDFVVKVPNEPGSYTWTAVFPEQENGGILHLESSAPLSFDFKPHGISMAVWDVPSPLVVDTTFTVKVGVRCSTDCRLTDKKIEIYDQEGGKVATETLGTIPWPNTDALYWAEAQLQAPGTEGYYQWTVKFPKPDLEPRHQEATYTLGFATARPPEHLVTVEVIDNDTKTPIANAHVVLHPYWGDTDEHGVAKIGVTKGHHELYISESGKKAFRMAVEVASDVAIKAELLGVPPDLEMS
jgi:hypothetical protein